MNKLVTNIPHHVAIIMDGNGRWATSRGLKRSRGHLEGSKTFQKIALHAYQIGIKILSVFLFSTENFKRSVDEVNYIMNLVVKILKEQFNVFKSKDIKVIWSGRVDNLSPKVVTAINQLVNATKNNKSGTLNLCFNYSGQDEIIDSVIKINNDLINKKITKESITRELLNKYLYHDLPPIDLLIRTGGEYRISNFMLWQLTYTELYFTRSYFPEFSSSEFDQAILEYNKRERRFGGIKDETKSH
ncbi:MAG: polyprenyl diphosphate synthase [Bacilli bacterium]|nr:polyprenyl diphosphate synthase [Bacilli bacterium]